MILRYELEESLLEAWGEEFPRNGRVATAFLPGLAPKFLYRNLFVMVRRDPHNPTKCLRHRMIVTIESRLANKNSPKSS